MIKKISFVLLSGFALFITLNFTLALYNTTNNFTNIFKSNGYTFLIDGTGGTFRNENITVISNSTTLPTPYRNGYTFLGYSENKNGSIDFSTTINNVNDINNKTIYACWNVNIYSISYDLNGGTINDIKKTYTIEDKYTLPIPTRVGYTFIGWSSNFSSSISKNYTISNMTGDLVFTANWQRNYYSLDVNSIIQNVKYSEGSTGFNFSVWINGSLVANNVKDYYKSDLVYNDVVRVVVHNRVGYSIKSFTDNSWTITSNLEINPVWYDDIPPVITSFSVTNLGSPVANRWDIKVYINGYDEGTGVQKFQNWLVPYGIGIGAEKADGQERTLKRVMYLNTAEGRTFCASIVDNAGNEAEKCETIRVN